METLNNPFNYLYELEKSGDDYIISTTQTSYYPQSEGALSSGPYYYTVQAEITFDDGAFSGATEGDSASFRVSETVYESGFGYSLYNSYREEHEGTYVGFLSDYSVILDVNASVLSGYGYERFEGYPTRILHDYEYPSTEPRSFLLTQNLYSPGQTISAAMIDGSTPYTCFAPGTRITTPQGPRPIESLRPGEPVTLADGSHAPLVWVGQQTIAHRFAAPERCALIQVAAGALGHGLPRRDLTLTSDHALFLDGLLVHAGAMVNGSSVRRLHPSELPAQTIVYHLELATQALILAEGCPSESFVDNLPRAVFDNAPSHPAGTQAPRIAPLPYPRVLGKRQLPPALRRRLAAAPMAA